MCEIVGQLPLASNVRASCSANQRSKHKKLVGRLLIGCTTIRLYIISNPGRNSSKGSYSRCATNGSRYSCTNLQHHRNELTDSIEILSIERTSTTRTNSADCVLLRACQYLRRSAGTLMLRSDHLCFLRFRSSRNAPIRTRFSVSFPSSANWLTSFLEYAAS